jgi:hypothetical protein
MSNNGNGINASQGPATTKSGNLAVSGAHRQSFARRLLVNVHGGAPEMCRAWCTNHNRPITT